MLKALMKKQFLEMNTFYFQDRKTGKRRSKGKTVGMVLLYIAIFGLLGMTFYGTSIMFAKALVPLGLGWLYFAIMALLSVFLGVFGGVFNTYSALYHAKDNELLLAMPIKPSYILTVRLVGVYLMGLLYEAIVFIPAVIAYFVAGTPTALSVVNCLLLILILGVLVLVLTCALGWVVALIASKLKNKSFITVIVSLVFFGAYYFFCGNYYNAIQNIITNADQVSVSVRSVAWPLYMMGRGAMGDAVGLLAFTGFVLVLLAATWLIMAKSFVKIATRNDGAAKVEYKEKEAKVSSLDKALLAREWKRFAASPVYMLNCALGTLVMLIAAVAVIVTKAKIQTALAGFSEFMSRDTVFVLAAAASCLLATMNDITAPSVSLEGKTLWLIQSLPVEPARVLQAKQKLHWYLTAPPAIVLSGSLSYVLGADFTTAVFSAVEVVAFVQLSAAVGLAVNLKRPNLSWTTETAPVKQSMGVMIALFGGWIVAMALGAAGYFLLKVTELSNVLVVELVVLVLATRKLNGWLKTKGAKIFAEL